MDKVDKFLDNLILKGKLKSDDPKFDFFKKHIVPALVNEWLLPNGACTNSFKCPFYVCSILTADGEHMQRHMQLEHYGEIPEGVFGLKRNFECFECEQNFTNFKAYKIHRLKERNEKLKNSKESLDLRRANILDKELENLIQNKSLNPNDVKLDVFKTFILPNVIFYKQRGFFFCPFSMCGFCNVKKEKLQEHLRDEHYDQIPLGVYGLKTSFKCSECNKNFNDFKTYKNHKHRCFQLKYFYDGYQDELVKEKLYEYKKKGLLKETDRQYKFFVREILPSLVTPKKLKSGFITDYYECPIKKCRAGTSKQSKLERHLIVHHSDLIPSNVFAHELKIIHGKADQKTKEKSKHEEKQLPTNVDISKTKRKLDNEASSTHPQQSKSKKQMVSFKQNDVHEELQEQQANNSIIVIRKRTLDESFQIENPTKREKKIVHIEKDKQQQVQIEQKKKEQTKKNEKKTSTSSISITKRKRQD